MVLRKVLREQDKFFTGFETKITKREKNFMCRASTKLCTDVMRLGCI